ncbi:MAG: aldehyde dehydrogenase family protein [Candidatus Poribacteria bacterium]
MICRNPATGEVLEEIETTSISALPNIFNQARVAQIKWAALSVAARSSRLIQLRETLLNRTDELIDLIVRENGKPRHEALTSELIPVVDMLTYFAKRAPALLKDKPIPLTVMKHRKSYLNYWPIGVVAIISPWNYPFMLPMGQILMALITGNAVIFKPSEETPLVGLKIQTLYEEAGLPSNTIQTLIGDGAVGAAIIEQKPDKIFFTGSAMTGKKILSSAAQHLIPVNLELGGKNAAIILPDANIDFASSAVLWGGFSNSGQICAAASRILVHESIVDNFISLLTKKIGSLRHGVSDSSQNDLAVITSGKQKAVYENQINEAKALGARFICGGAFSPDKTWLEPTIVTGPGVENLSIYNEESFGPILVVTTFKSPAEAIEKVNNSRYGLVASVITQNIALGEDIAKQLQVGTVMINEVVYTAGLAETPWGGVKESGMGRTHADIGLYEFVNIRHIHKPRSRLFTFKSPWWFPYTPYQYLAFRSFIELYKRHWLDKLRIFPHFLMNLIQFIKKEKRL